MRAYIFSAALLCEPCGKAVLELNPPDEGDPTFHTCDSNKFPQGPYENGGGEADCPQSCDHCHVFLQNPLTDDGVEYVRNSLLDHANGGHGSADVLQEWAAFYEVPFTPHLDDFTRAYIGCALWLSDEEPGPGDWSGNFDEWFERLDLKALHALYQHCVAFQAKHREDLDEALDQGRINGYDEARAGHDFWLSRNGAGAGFFDRAALSGGIGDKLQEAARAEGEVEIYTGDDKRIYAFGE